MIKRVNSGIYLHQTDLIKKIEEKFEEKIATCKNTGHWPCQATNGKDCGRRQMFK